MVHIFKSPKKRTKFLKDFCPSIQNGSNEKNNFIILQILSLDLFYRLGQKFFRILVPFLKDLKTSKFPSDINLPFTVGKTVTKKKFYILDFVVLVNSLGFKYSYETI